MTRISNTTMHGNSRTNPNGIEIGELPFNRMRRRKNDNPGSAWAFSFLISSGDGGFGDEGIRLTRPPMKPMTSKGFLPIRQLFGPRPAVMQAQFMLLDSPARSEENDLCVARSGVFERFRQAPEARRDNERQGEKALFPTTIADCCNWRRTLETGV